MPFPASFPKLSLSFRNALTLTPIFVKIRCLTLRRASKTASAVVVVPLSFNFHLPHSSQHWAALRKSEKSLKFLSSTVNHSAMGTGVSYHCTPGYKLGSRYTWNWAAAVVFACHTTWDPCGSSSCTMAPFTAAQKFTSISLFARGSALPPKKL